MKANLEAWQSGLEDGWNDSYHGLKAKSTFPFPKEWSLAERNHYIKGYTEGYETAPDNI
jgi:hypothetical protein